MPSYASVKRRTHGLLEPAGAGDAASRAVDVFIMSLIGIHIAALVLESVASKWQPHAFNPPPCSASGGCSAILAGCGVDRALECARGEPICIASTHTAPASKRAGTDTFTAPSQV